MHIFEDMDELPTKYLLDEPGSAELYDEKLEKIRFDGFPPTMKPICKKVELVVSNYLDKLPTPKDWDKINPEVGYHFDWEDIDPEYKKEKEAEKKRI
jgi:hypothetical protein